MTVDNPSPSAGPIPGGESESDVATTDVAPHSLLLSTHSFR